jgi:hypothetical protein
VATWRERNINFGHAPDGLPESAVVELLTKLVRAARPAP